MFRKIRGQSIVEWAVILPFLLLILISIVELAPLMNAFLKLEKAVQYAARVGATHRSTNLEIREAFLFNTQGMVSSTGLTGPTIQRIPPSVVDSAVFLEFNATGNLATHLEIAPGRIEERVNGGWVMVRAEHRYPIHTPLLRAVLNRGGFLVDGRFFRITRFAIFRIE